MTDHLFFIFYIFFVIFSTIGYGYIFSYIIDRKFLDFNIGYQGLFGFFSLVLLSVVTSFLTSHGYVHNAIVHSIGVLVFIYFFLKKISYLDKKIFFILFLATIISLYIYKNHDDFSYYHLTYILNLSENKFIIGTGNFSHGFRTFSSIFYFHSLLYLPYIKFYLFHAGPFLILLFFNFILVTKFLDYLKKKNICFSFFFILFSFTFVNVVFYRIAEHGTDRSAQILVFLIFIILFEFFESKKKFEYKKNQIDIIFILLMLTSGLKALYYIYLIIIPYIFYEFILKKKYFKKLNLRLIAVLGISFFLNISINFFNTGCLLYPASKTCFETEWSIPKSEVKIMNTHYEWWAKAGGSPGYSHELKKEDYIKNFVWVNNWFKRHFFNKVSDTLLGIIFICLLYFFLFKYYSAKKGKFNKKFNFKLIYFLIFIFLIEWFLKHPSMRYGGYVLIALPLFIYFSNKLSTYNFNFNKAKTLSYFLIFLVFLIFTSRNILRLNKEIKFYSYNILSSPFFYVDDVKSEILKENKNFKLFTTNNKMCWAAKTPCSYRKDLNFKRFYNYYIVYRE